MTNAGSMTKFLSGRTAAVAGVVILSLFIVVPSARAFHKYPLVAPALAALLYGLCFAILIGLLYFRNGVDRFRKVISDKRFGFTVIAALTVFTYFAYPIADGLKTQLRGSDQDDCVILCASNLIASGRPYMEPSYLGNLCSPGLGALLVYLPFILLGVYALAAPLSATAAFFSLRTKAMPTVVSGGFLVALASSVFVLELMAVGSDLTTFGFLLTVLCFGMVDGTRDRSWGRLVAYSVLCGLLASFRVNFLVLVPLMSFLVFLHWRTGGIVMLVSGLAVAILPSLPFYLSDPASFTPLHLVSKGGALLPGSAAKAALAASVVGALLGALIVKLDIRRIPLAVFISLLPGLAAISIGDLLLTSRGDLARWEGANYLMPVFPLAVAVLFSMLGTRTESASQV